MPDREIFVFLRDIDIYHIQKMVSEREGKRTGNNPRIKGYHNWAIIKKIDADCKWAFDKFKERTDFTKKEKMISLMQRQYTHIQHILARKGGKYNWSIINKINNQVIQKYYPDNGFYHDKYDEINYCNKCDCQRTFSNGKCNLCSEKK